MTEIERYTDRAPAWVATMGPAAELARQIADTEFVPRAMRGKPAQVAACVMFGDELGLGPMQSLAKIDVIEGTPTPKAELARALILGRGHEIAFEEMGSTRCTVKGRRKGSDVWTTVTWTMDDAKRAGLDGKQNWRKWPSEMLAARASAKLARLVFADCLGGIGLFAEELDGEETPTPAVKVQATVKPSARTRKLESVQASAEMPPLPGEVDDIIDAEIVEDANVDTISEPQIKRLIVGFNKLGVTGREERIELLTHIIGRPIATSKDLTKVEASQAIERIIEVEEGRAAITFGEAGAPIIVDIEAGE